MRMSKSCPECKSPDVTCQISRQMIGFMRIEHWMCRDLAWWCNTRANV